MTHIARAFALLPLVLAISANAQNARIKTIILSREIIKLCKKNVQYAAVIIKKKETTWRQRARTRKNER